MRDIQHELTDQDKEKIREIIQTDQQMAKQLTVIQNGIKADIQAIQSKVSPEHLSIVYIIHLDSSSRQKERSRPQFPVFLAFTGLFPDGAAAYLPHSGFFIQRELASWRSRRNRECFGRVSICIYRVLEVTMTAQEGTELNATTSPHCTINKPVRDFEEQCGDSGVMLSVSYMCVPCVFEYTKSKRKLIFQSQGPNRVYWCGLVS